MNPTATPLTPTDLQSAIVRNPLTVPPETTVGAAIAQMAALRAAQTASSSRDRRRNDLRDTLHDEARAGCVLVVAGEQFLGMVTERDIVRLSVSLSGDPSLNSAFALEGSTVGAVMTSPSVTVRESALPDWSAAVTLLQQQGQSVPVLDDDGRIVGVLTLTTLLAQTAVAQTAVAQTAVAQTVLQRAAEQGQPLETRHGAIRAAVRAAVRRAVRAAGGTAHRRHPNSGESGGISPPDCPVYSPVAPA